MKEAAPHVPCAAMNRVVPGWIAFWCGGAVMAYELLAARLLMPDFGTGIEVWSIAISITLICLSIGYWLGGRIADAWPGLRTLAILLVLAAVGLFAENTLGPRLLPRLALMSHAEGIGLAAVLLLAPPLLPMSAAQPVLTRLMLSQGSQTGRTVGNLLAICTGGSVAGTLGAGLIGIPLVGVSKSILILGAGTCGTAVVVCLLARSIALAMVFLMVGVGTTLLGSRWEAPRPTLPGVSVLDEAEGRYGHWTVAQDASTRFLICDGVVQTAAPLGRNSLEQGALLRGRDYCELIPWLHPRGTSALVIGVGGGLHLEVLASYGWKTQGVDLEPTAVRLARQYFGLAQPVAIADGRYFVDHDSNRHDAIVLDAFLGGVLPDHLYTREAFEKMAARMTPDGVICIHLIAPPQHPAVKAIARTATAVFPHIASLRAGISEETQHLYMFSSRSPLELAPVQRNLLLEYGFTGDEFFTIDTEGVPILTDDRTPLSLLAADLNVVIRQNSRQFWRERS